LAVWQLLCNIGRRQQRRNEIDNDIYEKITDHIPGNDFSIMRRKHGANSLIAGRVPRDGGQERQRA
jgi:hypothetical protein